MTTPHPYNVLFLCTHNSARSVLAEVTLNALGTGRFNAYSAGSQPKGEVNPLAVELLQQQGMDTLGLRSKSWDEFAVPGAPALDFVITVCDSAAGEACPYWPGRPVTAHWGVADPSTAPGDLQARRRAFLEAYTVLRHRIERLLSLPIAELEPAALKQRLQEIGTSVPVGSAR